MNAYQPQPEAQRFILQDVLRATEQLAALPRFADLDADLLTQVSEEAARFVGEVIAPLNRTGDEVGAQWVAGAVTMPPGFRDAHQAFWQAGWPSLACDTEDGGQGLPTVLEAMLYENLCAANHGWTMAPGLLHGAYECVKHHASPELKARYLEKLATGEWLATMCLTEPHAGSDLGLCRTKAVPLPNDPQGRYALSGTKIFISGGEHDLSDNIVHLVLARLPDSPPGPRGLSLFLVPKFYTDGDGRRAGPPQAGPAPSGGSEPPAVASAGAWKRSPVVCERIEEKMGLHGSPTCVMRFDEAPGWIVGEPGKGLNAMFVMMNAARLHVGLQGIGLLDAAWQKADAYSKERRQMRAPGSPNAAPGAGAAGGGHAPARRSASAGTGAAGATLQADLIEAHPAVRRILDTQRAWIDAGRVIAYRTALELDIQKHHPDAARRDAASRWCALVTPVLKAAWTEQGFQGASACLQVFGGHGYVREWGIEQIVRDARVTMIYEGTNEIQAIDLLLRKTLPDGAAALCQMLTELAADLEQNGGAHPGRGADTAPASSGGVDSYTGSAMLPAAAAPAAAAARARQGMDRLTGLLRERLLPAVQAPGAPPGLAHTLADDFLRALALLLMAWAWARISATPGTEASRWQAPQQAFWRWVWPEFQMRLSIMDETLARSTGAMLRAHA